MGKHAAGPWRVEETGGSMADRVRVVWDYADDEQIVIADCGVAGSEAARKHARLIAAAPRMLALLKRAAGILDRDELRDAYLGDESYDDARDDIEALISEVEKP